MPDRPDQHDDRSDDTQAVEYQHYGPPAAQPVRPASSWQAAPAWSTRPPVAAAPVRERRGPGLLPVLGMALVVGILSGGLTAAAVTNLMRPATSGPVSSSTGSGGSTVSQLHIDESSAVISAVDKVMPAVVTIASSGGGPLGTSSGVGSGLIYNANGWILTNKHVVSGASKLTVQLNDTRTFDARVIGLDTLTDLAIIKINARDLPVAPLGTSSGLELGQLAIAIGNPLGNFRNTVTTDVVSGLGRQIQAGDASQTSSEQLNNLIQTDAAINPGNSGGPLLNAAGQVIGINTAVASSAQGIGFAIPIDIAKPIMQQALAGKQLSRPWMGVYYVPVTRHVASDMKLSVTSGALIDAPSGGAPAVVAGGPAAQGGLRAGDVIVAVDGVAVDATHDLSTLIVPHAPGERVTLTIVRGGSQQTVQLTLGTLPTGG